MVCLFENQFQSLIASLRASHHADSTPRTGVGKDGRDRCQAGLRTTRAVRVHCAEARLRRQFYEEFKIQDIDVVHISTTVDRGLRVGVSGTLAPEGSLDGVFISFLQVPLSHH